MTSKSLSAIIIRLTVAFADSGPNSHSRGPLARAPALLLVNYRFRRRRRWGMRMAIVSTTVSHGKRRAYSLVTNRPWPAWRATLTMMIMTFSFRCVMCAFTPGASVPSC